MAKRINLCTCYLEHNDPHEMCDACAELHFERIAGHHDFLRDQKRDELMLGDVNKMFAVKQNGVWRQAINHY